MNPTSAAGRPLRPRQRRWLEETEIPPTSRAGARSSRWPTPPSSRCATSSPSSPTVPPTSSTTTSARSGPLRLLHGHRHDQGQGPPAGPGPARPRPRGSPTSPSSPAFLGVFERIGGPGLFGSYITPDRVDASKNIVYLAQGGLGLPDESYYRDDKFAEIREKYVAYLTTLLTSAGTTTRPARPPACWRTRPGWPRATGRPPRRATSRRPPTTSPRRAARALPGLRLGHLRHRPRRHRGDAAHHDRDAARLLLAPLHGARGDADRDLARHPPRADRPQLGAVPPRRVRPGQLRLLRPHPQRHAQAAGPLEARRRLRRGRDRRGGRQGLRLAPLPADVQGRRWTSWSPTSSRPTAARSRRSTGWARTPSRRPTTSPTASTPRSATRRSSATTPR